MTRGKIWAAALAGTALIALGCEKGSSGESELEPVEVVEFTGTLVPPQQPPQNGSAGATVISVGSANQDLIAVEEGE